MMWRWRPRSLRVRLTLWYAGALAIVLGLYAGGVFVFLWHSLSSALDRQLHDDFEIAEQMLARDGPDGVRWRLDAGHEEGEAADSGGWVDVWSSTGRLLYRSPGRDVDVGAPLAVASSARDARPQSEYLPGVGRVRALVAPYTIGDLAVVLRVVRSEEPLWHDLRELLLVLGLGFPLALGLAAFGGFALARRALRPVRDMAERARTITADHLGRRLPVDDPEGELGQLAIVFNDTLARLERSFAELRRFTADASHELRTPLTAIRSVGEVGLRGHRDDHAYREIIGSMLEEADRLTRLVDTLLVLSRADADAISLRLERIDVRALTDEITAQLEVLAEEKRQVLSIEAPGRIEVVADRLILRQALLNLLDNAIKYSPEGGHIRVLVGQRTGIPTIEVVDNGPGIAPEHREAIFRRFYRVDPARTRNAGGAGLGLCIARWAVELHGGRIELESEEGKGSTFRIVCVAPHEAGTGPRSGGADDPMGER
jgi:heavy metal sensor kinase